VAFEGGWASSDPGGTSNRKWFSLTFYSASIKALFLLATVTVELDYCPIEVNTGEEKPVFHISRLNNDSYVLYSMI
jgi:hypothetical protein